MNKKRIMSDTIFSKNYSFLVLYINVIQKMSVSENKQHLAVIFSLKYFSDVSVGILLRTDKSLIRKLKKC